MAEIGDIFAAPMSKSKKNGPCQLCGQAGKLTDEHVIPRCLVPMIYREQLRPIICRSCEECNNRKARVDGTLRDYLLMDIAVSQIRNRHATILRHTTARRAIKRGQAPLIKSFIRRARWRGVLSDDGQYHGHAYSAEFDGQPLIDALSWIVRGLFFLENSAVMQPERILEVRRYMPHEYPELLLALGFADMSQIEWIGNDCFAFRRIIDSAQPGLTVWMMLFYNAAVFMVLEGDPAEIHNQT
jgi:hypothetical protein